MCIRDSSKIVALGDEVEVMVLEIDEDKRRISLGMKQCKACLLYTSDAADERSSVDLGGRRIIKKKKNIVEAWCRLIN